MATCPSCRRGRRSTVRFGPALVERCDRCHALAIEPLADARVPGLQEHVDCLLEEIRVAQQEAAQAEPTLVRVDAARPDPAGAALDGQLVQGDPRRITKGARMEAWPADSVRDGDATNVQVLRRSASHVALLADRPAWRDLRRGAQVALLPRSDATVYRNLLKAFLVVRRRHDGLGALLDAEAMPRLRTGPVPGVDEEGLRPGQAQVLRAALNLPEDGVLLVHGPPGTGKTTVIARVLGAAVRAGHRVLVTSHTHVAIDNALRKALRHDPGLARHIVRLGDPRNVAPDLTHLNRRVGAYHMAPDEEDARPLFANLQQHAVVGMTLDALACAYLFADAADQEIDPFDLVVVDEAGMNGFPKTAIAHAVARRLVLVGDPLQLPPIVRAWSYREDESHRRSHFEVLQRQRPDLAVLLGEQFRCDPRIYSWSRDAVYGGRVQSRTTEEAQGWRLDGVELGSPVVWLNSAAVPGNSDASVGGSRVNVVHQHVAAHVLLDLRMQGMDVRDMGYISPFRAQADGFRALLEGDRRLMPIRDVTASTVDAFQGNERACILYDLTTMAPAKPHADPRRLNVSLTRAQRLLLILGPRSFVRDPRDNPYHASLQQWDAVQTLPSPVPSAPAAAAAPRPTAPRRRAR